MASSCPTYECKEISLLLLGKTGHGKSATGNSILGRTAFKKTDSANSTTVTAELNSSEREDGTVVRVVDTPGVMDTAKKNDHILPKVCEAMSLCPKGFNALIFVVKFGIRYTKEEKECLETLKEYFGSRFLSDYGVIVMTQGDNFDVNHQKDKITFKDWLERPENKEQDKYFAQLLQDCNNRCVLFYNVGKRYVDKRKACVAELLNLIKAEITTPYISEHIELAKVMREKAILKLGTPMLHTSVQEKLSLLIDQIHRDIKNNTFSYEAMLKNLDELEREVDSVKGEFKELSEFESLKESVASVRRKLQRIFSLEEREKQNAEQEQVLNDLETLKEAPDKILVHLARAFHLYAKVIRPIGFLIKLGIKNEFFEELERITQIMFIESVVEFQKAVKEFEEAQERHANLSNYNQL